MVSLNFEISVRKIRRSFGRTPRIQINEKPLCEFQFPFDFIEQTA
jgi:hypothetical protein